MSEKIKKINKAFILAGGTGSRIKLDKRQNLKAFIEINNEQLIKRHINLIKRYLNPEKIYLVITKFKKLFQESDFCESRKKIFKFFFIFLQ